MLRLNGKLKFLLLLVLASLTSATVFANAVAADSLRDEDISDREFEDFRLENIGPTNVEISFDSRDSENGLDTDRLKYILIKNGLDIDSLTRSVGYEDLFDDDEDGNVDQKYLLARPDLFLDSGSGDILREGEVGDLSSGVTNGSIDFFGLPENENFRMYISSLFEPMEKPTFKSSNPGAQEASSIDDSYVRIKYVGDSGGDPDYKDFEFTYLNEDGSVSDVFNGEEDDNNDLQFSFSYDSNGDFDHQKRGETHEYTLNLSSKTINVGDSWVIGFENGLLNDSEADIINVPHSTLLPDSDSPHNNLFEGPGDIRFSTDPFPSLLEGQGGDTSGFDIDGAPEDQDFRYLYGVESGTKGKMTLRFDQKIEITANAIDQIKLLSSDGTDYRNYDQADGGVEVSGDSKSLLVYYDALEPDEQYYISIPAGSLARNLKDNNNGLGQFNVGNEFNDIIFNTEKKPRLSSTYFNPGKERFDHTYSPFSLTPSDDRYRIPELVGVNKLGVGLNQLLVLQFDNKVNLNGNPSSKLKINSSGDNRNLIANAKVNEENPTELIITVEHGSDNKQLLKPDTIYDLVIEPGIVKDHFGGGPYAESDRIEVSFKTADGFKNAFLDKTSYELNSGLLETPSHNIAIDIPKVYIRNVETIHYRQGLAPDAQVAPNLTNIDVEADPDVSYITINTNQDERSKLERGANGKFTGTFAGLSADFSEMEITAYDENENELVTRVFRLQGAPGSEFKNDYVPEITDVFGKRISLYELMQNPDLMSQVLEQIPVSELDRIGVLEPYFSPYNDVQ